MSEMRAKGNMRLPLKGTWKVQLIRDGKVIEEQAINNGIVDDGMNYLLNAGFHAGAQVTSWYIGLIDSVGFTALAGGDTMGTHTGWAESTAYDEATHPQWTCDAAAARAIANSTTVDLTINTTKTLKGVFITSNAVKSSGTGTLWSTALFVSPMLVNAGDMLKLTYTVTGT